MKLCVIGIFACLQGVAIADGDNGPALTVRWGRSPKYLAIDQKILKEIGATHVWYCAATGNKLLTQAKLAFINREAFDYYYDFKVAAEAMMVLPETGRKRTELRGALNESLNVWDEAGDTTIPAAREVLAKKNRDTVHKLSAIGHSHIDTAWLWPLRAITISKIESTIEKFGLFFEY